MVVVRLPTATTVNPGHIGKGCQRDLMLLFIWVLFDPSLVLSAASKKIRMEYHD